MATGKLSAGRARPRGRPIRLSSSRERRLPTGTGEVPCRFGANASHSTLRWLRRYGPRASQSRAVARPTGCSEPRRALPLRRNLLSKLCGSPPDVGRTPAKLGRTCAKFGPHRPMVFVYRSKSGHMRPQSRAAVQNRPRSVQTRSDSFDSGPNRPRYRAEIGWSSADIGGISQIVAEFGPGSANIGATPTEVGPTSANFQRIRQMDHPRRRIDDYPERSNTAYGEFGPGFLVAGGQGRAWLRPRTKGRTTVSAGKSAAHGWRASSCALIVGVGVGVWRSCRPRSRDRRRQLGSPNLSQRGSRASSAGFRADFLTPSGGLPPTVAMELICGVQRRLGRVHNLGRIGSRLASANGQTCTTSAMKALSFGLGQGLLAKSRRKAWEGHTTCAVCDLS